MACWLISFDNQLVLPVILTYTCNYHLSNVGIPDDPRLAETFYEQDEFASDSDGDDDMESMCINLQSVLFDATCMYYETFVYSQTIIM